MTKSAGIIIVFGNSVLLCHPTNGSHKNTYSFPKGKLEKNESFADAAIRECAEETGIKINKTQFSQKFEVLYKNKKTKKIVKQVILFLVKIQSLNEINLTTNLVPKSQLQLTEIDWAGFLTKQECEKKIFWRFQDILDEIL